MKKHVFLSYCRDNFEAVAQLHADLVAAGEMVWWDQDILPGQMWKDEIRLAMQDSYAVLLCLSQEARARATSGIFPEALDAIGMYRLYQPGSIFLIPVRLSACSIPPIEIDATRNLQDLQYVDLFPAAVRDAALQRIVRALRRTPGHPHRDSPGATVVRPAAAPEDRTASPPHPSWAASVGTDEYGHYAEATIQGVAQRLRWIAAGEFRMGSPPDEPERRADETLHLVRLSQGFWLADTTCTQALWQAVMGRNPSRFPGPERPVEQVSWHEVQEFLERVNTLGPGQGWRLPTEAEWEYACRAGTTTPFAFGAQITPEQVNYDGNYPYAGGRRGLYRQETVPVRALPCNRWGLYQMHGNVWEWCQDWYAPYTGTTAASAAEYTGTTAESAAVDPLGPVEGVARVLRGGSWVSGGGFARSALRLVRPPGYRLADFGFRLVRGQAPGQ
ncbi:MAG: SUMF1/EgtB/PvdO family nonheme iron enzyme [Candidatus Tectimicrobiota bacterium]